MQLQYGRRYRSRTGQITSPLFKPEQVYGGQPFAGHFVDEVGEEECVRTWAPDGATCTGSDHEFDRDLVEELSDDHCRAARVADEQAAEMRRKLDGGLTPKGMGFKDCTADQLVASEWKTWFAEEGGVASV